MFYITQAIPLFSELNVLITASIEYQFWTDDEGFVYKKIVQFITLWKWFLLSCMSNLFMFLFDSIFLPNVFCEFIKTTWLT